MKIAHLVVASAILLAVCALPADLEKNCPRGKGVLCVGAHGKRTVQSSRKLWGGLGKRLDALNRPKRSVSGVSSIGRFGKRSTLFDLFGAHGKRAALFGAHGKRSAFSQLSGAHGKRSSNLPAVWPIAEDLRPRHHQREFLTFFNAAQQPSDQQAYDAQDYGGGDN